MTRKSQLADRPASRHPGRALRLASLSVVAGVLLAALLAVGPGRLSAADPPHWLGAVETTDCTSQCHTLHQAAGGQLTAWAQNAALCQSCHNTNGLPIEEAKKATPSLGRGMHHAYGVPAVNPAYDTQTPLDSEMSLRIMDSNIVCSTCHDQHDASSARGGTPRISSPGKVLDGGGSGTLATSGTFSGPDGVWYLVDVVANGSATSALYRYSKDNGTSWFPSGCTTLDTATCRTASDTPSVLENGVELTFTGGNNTLRVGDRWEFYASWPFLRATLDSGDNIAGDKFCRDCHRSWVMDHTAIDSYDGNYKSHPVGVRLDAAGGSASNRAAPLDGDGSASDANPTNDLKLDASGNVQCLTCHAPHYADSNTQTVDGP